MNKIKLLIVAAFFFCLSGCTFNQDTFTGEKNRTTCTLLTSDNVQTRVVLQHNGEEINGEIVKGEIAYLNYSLPITATIEEQESVKAEYLKRYPIESFVLIGNPHFLDIFPGKDGVIVRDLTIGSFDYIRGYDNVIPKSENPEFFQFTQEIMEKEVFTYQDFIEHLEGLGYECK